MKEKQKNAREAVHGFLFSTARSRSGKKAYASTHSPALGKDRL
jgi:hypothetical protein